MSKSRSKSKAFKKGKTQTDYDRSELKKLIKHNARPLDLRHYDGKYRNGWSGSGWLERLSLSAKRSMKRLKLFFKRSPFDEAVSREKSKRGNPKASRGHSKSTHNAPIRRTQNRGGRS